VPLDVLHSMRIIISLKTKKKLSQVDAAQTVRMLANGKSALQNEILGDFATEFKAEPENAGCVHLFCGVCPSRKRELKIISFAFSTFTSFDVFSMRVWLKHGYILHLSERPRFTNAGIIVPCPSSR